MKGGNMKITKLVILSITALPFIVSMSIASDFYGATVTDKDAPTAAWKAGIIGVHPTINDVTYDSPAGKAGFKRGDIILSINDDDVKRTSELDKFTTNTLTVHVFDGNERKKLTIDRLAIETEKARRLADEKKPATATAPAGESTDTNNESPDIAPPAKFDDEETH